MMPASTRSLSCQSALVTWNGIVDRSPYAVRPSKATNVVCVAMTEGAIVIHSGESLKCRSPPMGTSPRIRGSLLKGPHARCRAACAASIDGGIVRGSTATPAGGVTVRSPSPVRSTKRPSGQSSDVWPESSPATRMPAHPVVLLKLLRSTSW